MSRAWRIEFAGAYYHVLSRGNEQRKIFTDDEDRLLFLELIGEMSERFDIEIYAYVLMTNHYHVLLKTQKANLSESMQWFGLTYSRRYNIRHRRRGHLFQGRFKSFLIENDAYLNQLSYYIHRNPLRAGVIERLSDYKWSSYLTYAYGKKSEKWLKTKLILSQYKGIKKERYKAYRQKVQQYSKEEKSIWEDFRHGLFFGTQEFISEMRKKYSPEKPHKEKPQQRDVKRSKNIIEQLELAAEVIGADIEKYRESRRLSGEDKTKRDLLINMLWEMGIYKNDEIGSIFNVSYSSVSKSVSIIRKQIKESKKLKRESKKLNSLFKM
ncbi:MAG: transposase [Deltaproteobacteria bacterium]|nr:transposase [Deltaproteobacteria bacterium]